MGAYGEEKAFSLLTTVTVQKMENFGDYVRVQLEDVAGMKMLVDVKWNVAQQLKIGCAFDWSVLANG